MGKKLSDLGFNAQRRDYDLISPTDLSLVWHKRTAEFGPNDFLLDEHPELAWAYDPTIREAIPAEHVEMALSKKSDGCYVGILTPIGYRKIEVGGKLHLVVVFGRGRTRMARQANQRIQAAGGSTSDFINVPARIRDTDDVGAALERDLENAHRKTMTPTAIGTMVKFHVDKGTPEHLMLPLLRPCGIKSMSAAKRHLALLDAPAPIRELVDADKLPLTEALRVEPENAAKVVKAAEKGRLSARAAQEASGEAPAPKMMSRGKIEKWLSEAKSQTVKETLQRVLGLALFCMLANCVIPAAEEGAKNIAAARSWHWTTPAEPTQQGLPEDANQSTPPTEAPAPTFHSGHCEGTLVPCPGGKRGSCCGACAGTCI